MFFVCFLESKLVLPARPETLTFRGPGKETEGPVEVEVDEGHGSSALELRSGADTEQQQQQQHGREKVTTLNRRH